MNALVVQPMFSQEAEQSVIGGLLLDPRAWDSVSDQLSEADFYTEAHRLIYRRIGLMHAQRRPIDAITLAEALDSAGDGEQTGGLAYLGALAANTPSAANIRRYAEIVRDRRLLRDLLSASGQIADLVRTPSATSAVERAERAADLLLAVTQEAAHHEADPQSVSSVLPAVVEVIEERFQRQGEISGLRTGFTDLDRLTSGLQRGDLIVVAGRPSAGKTTFALNIAEHVALSGGAALVFSLEMSKEQLTERAISSVGGISNAALRSGKLTDDDFSRLTVAIGKLSRARLVIDEAAAPTIAQMRSRARRVMREHGLSLIVVDYIQLMGSTETRRAVNRNEEIGAITRGLKLLARELDVPVIALSQLSREVEKRPDKRPMMADLRDSGSIEQDADLILMAYRDEYYNPDGQFKGLAEVLVRKHRMGELGDVRLVFQGEFCRFLNADSEAWSRALAVAKEATEAKRPMRRARSPLD